MAMAPRQQFLSRIAHGLLQRTGVLRQHRQASQQREDLVPAQESSLRLEVGLVPVTPRLWEAGSVDKVETEVWSTSRISV